MLTQDEADVLISMVKRFVNPDTILMLPGTDKTYELIGNGNREIFLFDLWRGAFRLSKVKFQTRGRKVIVLVRLDTNGRHTNPDDVILEGPHIHLYREGYDDKWAFPLDSSEFSDPNNIGQTFDEFCRYCNIDNVPPFQEGWI